MGPCPACSDIARGIYRRDLPIAPACCALPMADLLFLDEIGELGPDEQAMLLRSLEDKRFLPVGSDKEVQAIFNSSPAPIAS